VSGHTHHPSVAPSDAAEINIRVLWCQSRYVRDELGESELERMALLAGLNVADLDDGSRWISMRQAACFLDALLETLGDEESYRQACVHRMAEAYGPLRYVITSTTPTLVIALAAKTIRLHSAVSACSVSHETRNGVTLRYESTARRDESRALCLSRQAQTSAVPTFFGLPPCSVHETSCIARGDDCCTYEFRYFSRSRWAPTILGGLAGVGIAWALSLVDLASLPAWTVLPMICGLVGTIIELVRTYRGNLAYAEEVRAAMQEMAEHEAEARRETEALHTRQHQWAKLMEEQVAERTQALEGVLARLRGVGEARAMSLRGFSHDLRNPLAVLRANQSYMRDILRRDDDMREVMDDNELAINRMERMLRDLVDSAGKDRALVRVNPETIPVEPLVDILRRRTRALVFGRPIKVSVFRTREAPEDIFSDRLVFERVMDNLCTNAAKYTERGSIVVELDGNPGNLIVKVSDTGCGIDDARMEGIFREGNGPDARSTQSLGVGLSVVVQLLAQIGGRLEVMSKPNQGTTFWAHFPRRPMTLPPRELRAVTDVPADPVSTVVTIRRLSA
jgi:signal transduction histidine kinase